MPDNPRKSISAASPTLDDAIALARWAQKLTAEERARARAGMIERRVPAGGFICRQGETPTCWIGIIEGLAKMSSDWVTGKTASYAGIPTGGWFGEGSLLKPEPRRYDVIALRDTRIACMRKETFQWLLDHSIPFNHAIIEQINERLGQFIGLLESARLHDTDTRVARSLAVMFNPVLYPGQNLTLTISQEEIGHLAGVSRQRVNRSLKQLEDAGFLRIEYGGVTILDLEGLRRFGGG
ncbi:MAG: Crp/Fnr family transcriptional regulator [Rhodocyclaceae bacterium]|nr:Crp/Fnr family transcriptional regulator [Rhodocyclaceae bacterium]